MPAKEIPKNLNLTFLQLGMLLFNVSNSFDLSVMPRLSKEQPENSSKMLFSIP